MALFASADDLADLLGEELTETQLLKATSALEVASAAIQNFTRQTIELVTDDAVVLSGDDGWWLRLPQRPVIEATVAAVDGVALAPGSYQLVGDALWRAGGWRGPALASGNWEQDWYGSGWWRPRSRVEVTYTHGYDSIPEDIRTLCLLVAARGMSTPAGVSQETIGQYSVTYGSAANAGAILLPDEERMLSRYRPRAGMVRLR